MVKKHAYSIVNYAVHNGEAEMESETIRDEGADYYYNLKNKVKAPTFQR